jgi:hypothetical protein
MSGGVPLNYYKYYRYLAAWAGSGPLVVAEMVWLDCARLGGGSGGASLPPPKHAREDDI